MTKYREYFDLMITKNTALFEEFKAIHNLYTLAPDKYQTQFNELGTQVRDVITEFENRLCRVSEKGQYAKFSHNLSDKFWEVVRSEFPKIDDVGIEVSYQAPPVSKHPLPPPPPPKRLMDQPVDRVVKDALDDVLNRMKKTNL